MNYYRVDNENTEFGYLYKCDEYPLEVILVHAPKNPRRIMLANYETCITGRMVLPGDISGDSLDEKFAWLINGGHTPSLETVHLTFGIMNASVVLLKQISRHRIGNSLGVMTQRANAEEYLGNIYDNEHYVMPKDFKKSSTLEQMFLNSVYLAQEAYRQAISEGVPQDIARYIIPQCATTMWQGTYAYKTLLDSICSTRLCRLMQGEMVALANLMRMAVIDYDRYMGYALKPICYRTGFCNRNENNPTDDYPKGICEYTKNGEVAQRAKDSSYSIAKWSRDNG